MEINLQTKIGDLLDAYPELEETLLGLSPAFAKLRNPVLRRTAAKVATVQQAAKIAGISPASMVKSLRDAAGLTGGGSDGAEGGNSGNGNEDHVDSGPGDESRPGWFDESKIAVRFDAGPTIDSGGSPMSEILRLAKGMSAGEIMELSAPFRPEPIMDILRSKNFGVWYGEGKTYFLKRTD